MKKILALILAAAISAALPASVCAGTETAPAVSAASFAVYDATAGRFLACGAGDTVRRMASTTKIMTALVALESFPTDAEVEFSREMAAEGSSMYLKYGERVALRDLLYGLLLMSGNDAARAIASLHSGGEEGFVATMNERAKSLGLVNTSFANPNGLDADGHHTTAKELALLTAEAMKNDTFREIVSTYSGTFAGRTMTNHNKLLKRVEGCVGVKTGYTTGAGRCLVSAVERDGRLVIVVTLDAPNDWRDHESLYDWAFRRYTAREIISADRVLAYQPVEGGLTAKAAVRAERSVTLALTEDELERLETETYLARFVYAPVETGAAAGEVAVLLDGEELARVQLVYASGSERAEPRKLSFSEKVKDWFETLAWKLGL